VLKERGRSRGVYRLSLASGQSIIAKRGHPLKLETERYIYEKALPTCGATPLEFFGAVAGEAEASWIFIEAACGVSFDREDPEHRVLAARWFAGVHTCPWSECTRRALPRKDVHGYRDLLDRVRARLAHVRASNSGLPPDGIATIAELEARLRDLSRSWSAVEKSHTSGPNTIVHSDIQPKNMVVSPAGELMVFDWEHCGFGDPSRDIDRCLDVDAYLEAVVGHWPWITRARLERMASMGEVLRLIDAIDWDSGRLDSPWWGRPLRHMEHYAKELRTLDLQWLGV
jgi:hypothetical protein